MFFTLYIYASADYYVRDVHFSYLQGSAEGANLVYIIYTDYTVKQEYAPVWALGSRMKFKTLCYPVFGRNKNIALPSF